MRATECALAVAQAPGRVTMVEFDPTFKGLLMALPELDGDYIGIRSRLIHIDARIRKKDYPNQSTLAKLCGV